MVFLAGCTLVGPAPPAPIQPPAANAALLRDLAEVAVWSADRQGVELRRLRETPRSASDQLRFAWLQAARDTTEARSGAARAELARRLHEHLLRLDDASLDADSRHLLRLLQRLARCEQDLRQERSQTLRLQDKIERIKALEQELNQRTNPVENGP